MSCCSIMSPTKVDVASDELVHDLIDRFSKLSLSTDFVILSSPIEGKMTIKRNVIQRDIRITRTISTFQQRNKHFEHVDLNLNVKHVQEKSPEKQLREFADRKQDTSVRSPEQNGVKYYAVALIEGTERATGEISDGPLVYTNIKDALQAIKVYKGSRCREFRDKGEALNYALKMLERQERKKSSEDDGPKSATCQELCQLRKCIEKGEEVVVAKTIWKNPKMLIGRSDTPSIMQEGSRYNAFHVAAKSNRATIIQLILDALEDLKFAEMLYPSDPLPMRLQRMRHIIDLYLNTPDKKLGDTPLHFASKFGCTESVKLLASHPDCDKHRRNNAGQTAQEIICSRLPSASDSLKNCIEEAFKGMVYIPILRTEKNDVPPIIGKPCVLKEIDKSKNSCDIPVKLKDPTYSVKAFAGPMSPKVAEQFYQLLKRPFSPKQKITLASADQKLISKIRLTDPEKGVERIGRRLAEEMKIDWEEYFPVIDCFANFSSIEGLKLLEMHLEGKRNAAYFEYVSSPFDLDLIRNINQNDLEKNMDNEIAKDFFTPPSSPSGEEFFVTPPTSPPSSPTSKEHVVFLQGPELTRLDIDVLLAIGDFRFNTRQFPNASKWRSAVERLLVDKENDSSEQVTFTPVTSLPVPRLLLQGNGSTPRRKLF